MIPARPEKLPRLDGLTAWNGLKSGIIEAQFEVAVDGSTKVTLLQKTGNEQVDMEVLEFLKTVRWQPKTIGGIPAPDVQPLEFTVEH